MYEISQRHIFSGQLSREWEHLRRRPSELDRARSWRAGLEAGALAGSLDCLDDLDQIVRATDSPNRSMTRSAAATSVRIDGHRSTIDPIVDADIALLQLVELARHDQLAGRIVIQRLLPGLIAHGARYRNHHDALDPAELVVAAAWIAMHRYDTATRRRHVAASLISDATFQAFRQPLRRRCAGEEAVPVEQFDQQPALPAGWTAIEQLADVVRLAHTGGVAAADLQLVRELAQVGSANLVAARHGVTPRTIRNRRDRAIANIRRVVLAA